MTGEGGERLDWEAVRRRLDELRVAAREALQPTGERAQELLEERARSLARRPEEEGPANTLELLRIVLDGEPLAIETRFVREVFPLGAFTRLPHGPPGLRSVTSLRGSVLPLLDLGHFVGRRARDPQADDRVVVLGEERPELGLLAERAEDIQELAADEVARPGAAVLGTLGPLALGVAGALVVLDGARLLADERLGGETASPQEED